MTGAWDDLLRDLPLEAMDGDLPLRLQERLRAQRSKDRRLRLVGDAAMIGLVILGLAALAPQLTGAENSLTLGTLESSTAWVSQFGTAPAPAVWGALAGGLGWARHLATSVGIEGLLGMILISVPLFVWLRRLMPERAASGENLGRPFTGLEEGAPV